MKRTRAAARDALRRESARSPWRAHVACVARLQQRQSFSRKTVVTVQSAPTEIGRFLASRLASSHCLSRVCCSGVRMLQRGCYRLNCSPLKYALSHTASQQRLASWAHWPLASRLRTCKQIQPSLCQQFARLLARLSRSCSSLMLRHWICQVRLWCMCVLYCRALETQAKWACGSARCACSLVLVRGGTRALTPAVLCVCVCVRVCVYICGRQRWTSAGST